MTNTITDMINAVAHGYLPKWPQMIVSGKSVTIEQAKEIIFRTDAFLTDAGEWSGGNARRFNESYRKKAHLDKLTVEQQYPEGRLYRDVDWEKNQQLRENLSFIHTEYVNNTWASCCFIGGPHGWCHPDGTIGYSDNVGKWPNFESIYEDWVKLAEAFPFLDLQVTLMDGEDCEDNTQPVINFRIVNGAVEPQAPDLSVHKNSMYRRKTLEEFIAMLELPSDSREIGLPKAWYDEFAERVAEEVEKILNEKDGED